MSTKTASISSKTVLRGQKPAHTCWHIVTHEYPPMFGGVSDYTRSVAIALAAHGDEVHVWCPARAMAEPNSSGVVVHPELGSIRPRDLWRVGVQLDRFPEPRRLLVQWVPHGYGPKAINIGFCWWVLKRAIWSGDQVEFMVHEAFLSFTAGSWKHNVVALVQRCMTLIWLASCRRVWLSIPSWEKCLRPFSLGRKVAFCWLPIPSNVPVAENAYGVERVRQRCSPNHDFIVGHFGTFGLEIASTIEAILNALIADPAPPAILLMGKGSESFRTRLLRRDPRFGPLLHATDEVTSEELSYHLQACDLLIQPYPDGVSTRRGSIMAGLSHGKPIITTAGFLTEPFWERSNAVAISAVNDLETFVSLVRRLRANAAERQRMGVAARDLYEERFELCHTITALRQTEVPTPTCVF